MAFKPKYDIINIIDFELTCSDDDRDKTFNTEIVDVGIVGLDNESRDIVYVDSCLIKPCNSVITQSFTDLTGYTNDDFKNAMKFKKAVAMLQSKYLVARRTWIGYGRDDLALIDNCMRSGARIPFSDQYINLQSLIAMRCGWTDRISLSNIVKKLGMDFIGRPHRAKDDAYNTARVFMKIMWDKKDI